MDRARLADARPASSAECRIHRLALGPWENLVYLIEDRASGAAAVVDPAWEVERITRAVQQRRLTLTDVLLTHGHDDHVNGLAELLDWCGTRAPRVHLAAEEAVFWRGAASAELPLRRPPQRRFEVWSALPDAPLTTHEDGAGIALGDTRIEMIHTPGHSPGSVCYRVDGSLITGDTLFVYGCGRCDLDGSDPRRMFHSLQRLKERIPDEMVVLPGHQYAAQPSTTMGEQRRANPFLHFDEQEAFVAFRAAHNRHRHPPYGPVPRGEPAW
jgi:glyoxylase-like metal-dependent hydrolase (beta-lactamase superfamily II)